MLPTPCPLGYEGLIESFWELILKTAWMIQRGQLGTHVVVHQKKLSIFYLFVGIFCFLGKVKTRHSSKQNVRKAVFVTLTSVFLSR